MSSKCQHVMQLIEEIAPKYLAENWDNVGLHIGSPNMDIKRVLVCLDVDEDVVKESIEQQIDLIISHHPLIFSPLKNIRWDQYKGAIIKALHINEIAVYCAHTNIDISNKGLNHWLGDKLQLKEIEPLDQLFSENLYKYVIYVPESHIEVLREELGNMGAGYIGNYSHCTFTTSGTGTFKPRMGSNPYIGSIGQVEKVRECRLESIIKERDMAKVTKRMLKIHPYEEVAYDIYPLDNMGESHGLGVIGQVKPTDTDSFISDVKNALGISTMRIAGKKSECITKVALCTGAGASLIRKAKYAGAQVFITGDIKYHDAQLAKELGIFIIDAGHFATEKLFIDCVTSYLNYKTEAMKMKVDIISSQVNRDYIQYV